MHTNIPFHTLTRPIHLQLQHKTLRYWREVVRSMSGPEHQTLQKCVFHFLCFRLVLNFFYFCKQFLKNKQTSKQTNKNTPEYSLHCFPLLTPIYFSYELTVYFFFFFSIITNVRTVKHLKPAVY